MKKSILHLLASALVLVFASSCYAAEPNIEGDRLVAPYKLVRLKAVNLPEKSGVLWSVVHPPGVADLATTNDKKCLQFVAPPGSYSVRLLVITLDADGIPQPAEITTTVIIGKPDPVPPTPVPPGPVPPTPDPPTPPPGPAPIPVQGFRVLMVYETGKVQELPPSQWSVLYSKQIRDYLDSKCVVGTDGTTKEWRIWDQDIDTSLSSKIWQDAMKRSRQSTPWIIISTGQNGYEGPLPKTVDETLNLLKKYGG